MFAKLEWTQSNLQQNIEQLQNPTMGENNQQRINNNRINRTYKINRQKTISTEIVKTQCKGIVLGI